MRWLTVGLVSAGALAVTFFLVLSDGGEPSSGSSFLSADRPEARQALRVASQQRQRLASPAARRERVLSQSAFTGLPAARALSVGRRVHPSILRDRTPKPLEGARRRGLRVAGFASPYAAILRPAATARAKGRPGLMAMSTLALRSRDDQGQLRMVSLAPERVGDRFVPDNARVKLSIGTVAADGVQITDRDIAIVPLDVRAAQGVASGDSVLFANSLADSDHIVRVSPAGVQNLVQLRGRSSPERLRYRVDLPAGGQVEEVAGGEFAVRIGGRRVGTIVKPTAWDADHQAIPVKATLQGRILTLDVAHRARDIRYPAIADPNYVDILQYRYYTPGNNNNSLRYWAHRTNRSDLMNGVLSNIGQGKSLVTGTRGNQIVPAGTFAYWTFTAPGTTSVAQVEWTRLTHSEIHNGPAPCIDFGLTLASTAWHPSPTARGNQNGQPVCSTFTQVYRLNCWDCNDRDGVSHDPNVKGAQFGTSVYQSSIINQLDQAGEVTLYVVDPDDPTVTFTSQAPSGWMNTPTGTISATGNDPGLGVQSMQIANATPQSNSDCLDAGPCPFTQPISTSVASLNLPDGNNAVPVTAKDASFFSLRDANGNPVSAQHSKTETTPVKLDRTPPTITPTGTLYDARNGFVGPNQDYTLSVTATDGSPSPASAQRSGTTSLTATLNGQPMTNGSKSEPCTRPESSCPLTISPTLTGAQVAELDENVEHTVTITSSDALGQASTPVTFKFRVDVSPPTTVLSDVLADMNGRTLTEDGYRLRAEATDNLMPEDDLDDEGEPVEYADVPGSGLRDIVVRLDGASVPTSATSCFSSASCEDARLWDWDTRGASNDVHVVSVTAADNVGNLDEQEFEVTLRRVADQPPRTNATIRRTIIGAALNDRAGSATAALGDVNGDGFADYAVGAPGAGVLGRSAAGAAYVVMGTSSASTVDLSAPGAAAVRILGPESNQYCGTSVAALGDVNGDEIGDLAIGCPGVEPDSPLTLAVTGRVYVVFGRTDPQTIDLANLGTGGFVITGPSDSLNLALPGVSARPAVFGERLQSSPVGQSNQDVNDDGQADIVIGDSAVTRDSARGTGAAYVIYGKADNIPVDATALAGKGFVIRGDHATGLAGYSAAIIDDVTGDTLADVLVGAPGATTATAGRAYVVAGAAINEQGELSGADVDLRTGARSVTLTSPDTGDRFGVNVAVLGDTDLNVSPDFAIGTRSGAFVVRKVPPTSRQLTVDDGFRITGPANTPGLLSTKLPEAPISPAEDLDGDEREDLIIGYPDAAGARAYTISSPETPRTIDVAALPGQRGSAVSAGPANERGGAAVAANSYQGPAPVTETAQAIVGAPQASGGLLRVNAGKAYVVAEPTPSGPGVEPPPDDSGTLTEGASSPSARALAAPRAAGDDRSYDALKNRPRGRFVADPVGPDTDSITVRNDFQFLVIGNLNAGQAIDVRNQQTNEEVSSGTNQGDMPAFYYFGRAYGAVRRCGWVVAYKTRRLEDQPSGPGKRCGPRRLAPRAFSRLINCDHCPDGSEFTLRGHGKRAQDELDRRKNSDEANVGRIPYWRNVQPGTREGLSPPSGYLDVRTSARRAIGKGDVRLSWRYLSRSKGRMFARFALIRAPRDNPDTPIDEREPGLENNKWAFIERRWLPRGTGKNGLCDNTGGQPRGTRSPADEKKKWEAEFLGYEPEQATDSIRFNRRNREKDWPPVCSHKLYGVPTP